MSISQLNAHIQDSAIQSNKNSSPFLALEGAEYEEADFWGIVQNNMERQTWTTEGGEMLGMLHFDIPEKVVTSRNGNDFAPQDAKT